MYVFGNILVPLRVPRLSLVIVLTRSPPELVCRRILYDARQAYWHITGSTIFCRVDGNEIAQVESFEAPTATRDVPVDLSGIAEDPSAHEFGRRTRQHDR